MGSTAGSAPRLGIRANLAQFSLLVLVNALVGGLLGQERILTGFGEAEFGVTSATFGLLFIVVFGVTKAATNFFAGTWSDRYGRKPVLIAGWLVALPVPLLLIWGPSWEWVIAANVLLGVNQGLAWSATVVMKIDLAGPARRGLAMGLNEAAGYGAVAVTAMLTGWLAESYGWRPVPFLIGAAYVAIGLGLSTLVIRETRAYAALENGHRAGDGLSTGAVFRRVSLTDRTLSSISQAGLVTNLNDGVAWGLFPVLFAAGGLSLGEVGAVAAVYPAVWGVGQLLAGPASDRLGRKPLIVTGMLAQAAALAMFSVMTGFAAWVSAGVLLGAGTALVYPTLLAAIGDASAPQWRGRALGVFRLWRDAGFAVGAIIGGVLTDLFGLTTAITVVAALTATSGLVVLVRFRAPDDHAV